MFTTLSSLLYVAMHNNHISHTHKQRTHMIITTHTKPSAVIFNLGVLQDFILERQIYSNRKRNIEIVEKRGLVRVLRRWHCWLSRCMWIYRFPTACIRGG